MNNKIMAKTWSDKFMATADLLATWSKDPNHGVGCVIVDDDHNQLSAGYNGLPRNVKDAAAILQDRELKLKLTVHAEANAVAAAARNGHSLKGGTVYITLPPCSQCAALLIQAGVERVIYRPDLRPDDEPPSKWLDNRKLAFSILHEAGILVSEYFERVKN